MAVNFFDTSALVKRYVNESGTEAVVDICNDASATLVIADITRAELISALNRRAGDGSISEDEHQLLKAAFAMHLIRDYLVAAVRVAGEARTADFLRTAISMALRYCPSGDPSARIAVWTRWPGSSAWWWRGGLSSRPRPRSSVCVTASARVDTQCGVRRANFRARSEPPF